MFARPAPLSLLACLGIAACTGSAPDGPGAESESEGEAPAVITGPGPDENGVVSIEPSPDCPIVSCGGDPLGRWSLRQGCRMGARQSLPGCPEGEVIATLGVRTLSEFRADGGYTFDHHAEFSNHMVFPAACASEQVCDAEGCVAEAGGCRCVNQGERTDIDEGRWHVTGTALTVTPIDKPDNPRTGEFCVDGDVMHYFTDYAFTGVDSGAGSYFIFVREP